MNDPVSPLVISPTESGFAVRGEIDAHSSQSIREAIEQTHLDHIVIDMSGVDFVDSSGLRVLIEIHQFKQTTGGSLMLARPSAVVSRLLAISGVDGYLIVAD